MYTCTYVILYITYYYMYMYMYYMSLYSACYWQVVATVTACAASVSHGHDLSLLIIARKHNTCMQVNDLDYIHVYYSAADVLGSHKDTRCDHIHWHVMYALTICTIYCNMGL
jgi:hypothetical protein